MHSMIEKGKYNNLIARKLAKKKKKNSSNSLQDTSMRSSTIN